MRIMINLLPLKTGGGVQVAMDFLAQAEKLGAEHQWFIVARKDGPFANYQACDHIELVHLVSEKPAHRLRFEYVGCKEIIKLHQPDVVYTQFGPHWPGSNVPNIAGCAYSNLFYPELDFWGSLPPIGRLRKSLIDSIRLRRLLSADIKVFETEDLASRAKAQYKSHANSITYVKPTVSSMVSMESYHQETHSRCNALPKGFKIVLLAAYHPNKNIEFLIDTARTLKLRGVKDFCFVLTLSKDADSTHKILQSAENLGVSDHIYNLGTVPQVGCSDVYRACDAAILPSMLESFSNMIAESWLMQTPLLISDLSWAKALCGSGAQYYDYLNCDSLANEIERLKDNKELGAAISECGRFELSKYPTSADRFHAYLAIIESTVNSNTERKACYS